MPTDQPDASDLRERVADLEATVSDQQDTIQQLMPSRRQAIAGMGLLGGGLLGGRLSTGTARAQAAGQVGTDTDPVDVQAWGLDVQNGVTSDLPMGGNDVTDVGALDVEGITIEKLGTRVTATEDQVISQSTDFTTVDFGAVDYDDESAFDLSTNTYTAPSDGLFMLNASVRFDESGAGDELGLQFSAGGSTILRRFAVGSTGNQGVQSNAVVRASSGDDISIGVRNLDGDDEIRGSTETWFSVVRF